MADPSTLNSINSKNRKRIMEKGVDWLPDANLDKLEDLHQKVESKYSHLNGNNSQTSFINKLYKYSLIYFYTPGTVAAFGLNGG